MRSEKYTIPDVEETKDRNKYGCFSGFTRFAGIIFLLVSAAFAGVLVFSGFLPSNKLFIALGVVALIFLLLFPVLFIRKFKKSRKVIAFILSLIVGSAYIVGIWYIAEALGFIGKITDINQIKTNFYVIVRDDNRYNQLEDIAGEKVLTFGSGAEFDKAKTKLTESVDVELEEGEDLIEGADNLLSGKENALFMPEAKYKSILEAAPTFSDDTKILKKISILRNLSELAKPVEVANKSFNIFISGIDTEGTIDTTSRSDVNMVMTVDPEKHKILLTSIPRDYYVQYPDHPDPSLAGQYDKLTHSGIYGSDETVATVEKLLGITINYYVKVNYTTITTLIDEIGGIDVYSDYAFTASDYTFWYDQGINTLGGAAALRFARERDAFEDGDFQRNKNQQAVLKALIEKLTSSRTLLTGFPGILNSVKDYIEMSFTGDEIKSLVRMQLKDMPSWSIEQQSITGAIGNEYCYALGNYASVVLQDEESVSAAAKKINQLIKGTEIKENN